MKLILVLLAFLLFTTVPANADIMTSYDVTYYLRGDVSQTTKFYGDGAYEFLLTPNYVTVYVHAHDWIFIGMYGAPALGYPQATLPASMPGISFPAGTDGAVAVPINIVGGGGPTVVATPELAILRSFAKHVGGRQLNAAVNPTLQRVTAWGAGKLLGAKSLGVYVVLPTKILEVQEWCSGVSTLKWLVLLAVIFAVVNRVGLPVAGLVVAHAVVIGVAINILRVAGIGYGYDKDAIGWITLTLGVAQVVGLGWVMKRRAGRA